MEKIEMVELKETLERLTEAVEQLEQTVQMTSAAHIAFAAESNEVVTKVTAMIEPREAELERRLAEAEQTIAELRASSVAGGRKTVVAGSLVAKAAEGSEMGALDGALASLSVEQRFAVKAEMLRSGLLR